MKSKIIDSFFKKKSTETTQSASEASQIQVPPSSFVPLNSDACLSKIPRVEDEALDLSNLEREPGLPQNIEVSLDGQTIQQISANRLRLKTSIDVVRWLSFQGCAFRGHNESPRSKNRGKFLELLSLLASAPQNASYTSSTIQKEILQIYANRVRNVIREEIGDRKLSIIVDEARDEFVDKQGQNVIFNVLLQHSFDIQNIRGQGYDGASNMRGEFNGLQALLALVAAAREVVEVHQFFKDLSDIVNIASASSKRHDELQKAQAAEIFRLVSINELATGTGMNQIGTLQRPGETRWSSHLNSVTSLLKMYNATSTILENLKNTEVLGITDNLCQSVQRRSQDILNAMSLVLTTKDLIQKLRDDGWNELLKNVISFCETSDPNKKEDVTVEHHYRVDIVFATIDTQLQELKSRFNENVVELFTLTTALDPKEFFKLFDIDKICILKERLPYELKHYELDVCKHSDLRKISTLSELCRSLVESGKSFMYPFVDRLICLILTIPIVKNRLRSKMEDDFLRKKFDINEIIDDFSKVKDRRVQFK
ncbi:hypothetical protein V6Z12_A06G097000 [Gossypium hirsutum]